VPLRIALMYAVVRAALAALSVPAPRRHRRPRWLRRAARAVTAVLRAAAAYPDAPVERYRPAHRRPGRRPTPA
jgi:hypothetical protein